MKTLPYSAVRIDALARKLDISARTLRNIFQDYFSASPKAFLKAIVVRSVRDALLRGDPKVKTVTDTLLEHGIYEFGRFAGHYRQLYGELPSETLQGRRHSAPT